MPFGLKNVPAIFSRVVIAPFKQFIHKLLEVLQQLVEGGDSVLVIEHNLDVIKTADHIIDLGPEGGSGGGKIVAQGTPEQVAKVPGSYTGQFLKKILKNKK